MTELRVAPSISPSSSAEVAALARAAGLAGRRYMEWTLDDDVQRYADEHEADSEAWAAAYEAGLLERRRTVEGWVERWTTAPADYDTFGTSTLAVEGEWHNRTLRRILVQPAYERYQLDRYGSGLHASWSEDPREAERRLAEALARERALAEEHVARDALGRAWLAGATDAALDAALEDDDGPPHGMTCAGVRGEQRRRSEAREAAARAAEYDRYLALVAAHEVLVDDGAPAVRSQWNTIPGRDSRVYYGVSVEGDPDDRDLDRARVVARPGVRGSGVRGSGVEHVASLSDVAWRIEQGTLRGARLTDVPPEPVLRRVGHRRLADVRRLEAAGRVVWVDHPYYMRDPLILDERGRVVRARAVVAAVLGELRRT
jgi:hypothetical protein